MQWVAGQSPMSEIVNKVPLTHGENGWIQQDKNTNIKYTIMVVSLVIRINKTTKYKSEPGCPCGGYLSKENEPLSMMYNSIA